MIGFRVRIGSADADKIKEVSNPRTRSLLATLYTFALFICLVCLMFLTFIFPIYWMRFQVEGEGGAAGVATVNEVREGRVRYTYDTGTKRIKASRIVQKDRLHEIVPGTTMEVRYLERQPFIHRLVDPTGALVDQERPIILIGSTLLILAILMMACMGNAGHLWLIFRALREGQPLPWVRVGYLIHDFLVVVFGSVVIVCAFAFVAAQYTKAYLYQDHIAELILLMLGSIVMVVCLIKFSPIKDRS